jgi:hypothetical protein
VANQLLEMWVNHIPILPCVPVPVPYWFAPTLPRISTLACLQYGEDNTPTPSESKHGFRTYKQRLGKK